MYIINETITSHEDVESVLLDNGIEKKYDYNIWWSKNLIKTIDN